MRIMGFLAILLVAVGVGSISAAKAGSVGWIHFPGVCYDYDPYDRYQLYGKYYPYSGNKCRHRSISKKQKVKPSAARRVRGDRCVRSNIKNQRNACSG